MIGRLLLLLLLASFAAPAAAVGRGCHDAPAATVMAHHDAPAAPDEEMPAHLCIGCVPLADWLGERVSGPVPVATIQPAPGTGRLDLIGSGPPALPPPRAA